MEGMDFARGSRYPRTMAKIDALILLLFSVINAYPKEEAFCVPGTHDWTIGVLARIYQWGGVRKSRMMELLDLSKVQRD
ncbi:hypothetical protein K438DRAFT_1877471 [Mycena galopus ATCC 62051]|nr:hypothetical protein K438DRAFT_1877471 [Mycena galopus ATCC 62051]